MGERFKSLSAVMLLLTREKDNQEEILFQKRKNTGYCDGFFDLSASGHVEKNESITSCGQLRCTLHRPGRAVQDRQ